MKTSTKYEEKFEKIQDFFPSQTLITKITLQN